MRKYKCELNPLRTNADKKWIDKNRMILSAKNSLNAENNYRKALRKKGWYYNPCQVIIEEMEDKIK